MSEEVRGERSEGRGQSAEVKGQRAEVKGQRSEVRVERGSAEAFAAFIEAQKEMPQITFDRENPHFRSRYATLQNILAEVRPVLNRHGIALTTRTRADGDTIMAETWLVHNGVWFVGAEWPAGKVTDPAQKLGSGLTYARRYTLQSLLGVAADDDDDDGDAAGRGLGAPTVGVGGGQGTARPTVGDGGDFSF